MPLKLKHVFKGPSKVFNAIGESGVFGQRGEHFRVLGLKIGKDLVPVVQGAALIAAVALGGPALAVSTGMSATTAAVVTGSIANAAVTGCSGGNESQVLKAAATGGATAVVGNMVQASSTMTQAVSTHVAGNAAVSLAAGEDFKTSMIQAATSIPLIAAPTNVPMQYAASAVAGAMLNDDNSLRGALQHVAITAVKTSSSQREEVNEISDCNLEPENTATVSQESKNIWQTISARHREETQTVPQTLCTSHPEETPNIAQMANVGNSSFEQLNPAIAAINIKPSGISVTMSGADAMVGASVSNKSAGISVKHSDNTSSKIMVGKSDIYEHGIVYDKQTTILSGQGSNNNNPRISSNFGDAIVQETVGSCFASRSTVSSSVTNDVYTPSAVSVTSNQIHVNLNCVAGAMGIATAVVFAPEVTIPALLLSRF